MIADKYCISSGTGKSEKGLPSFDKALIEAGVGNYNLVRLSSILPARCERVKVKDITKYIKEGSLLPTAYSTITSDTKGDFIISTIGVGIPKDSNNVGVIMEYSTKNVSIEKALKTLQEMIEEAFDIRCWELAYIESDYACAEVKEEGVKYTTFACISEW